MSKLDLLPEGLERLASTRVASDPLRSIQTRDGWIAQAQEVLRALAAERRNDFMAGALAMREAALKRCVEIQAEAEADIASTADPICGGELNGATSCADAIRTIDPASLTKKQEPEVCEACEGHGCVATHEKDGEGFPIEVACPVCNLEADRKASQPVAPTTDAEREELAKWLLAQPMAHGEEDFMGVRVREYREAVERIATLLRQPVAPVVDDAMVARIVDALAQAPLHIQGFLYGQRHVIRNVHAPADKQEIWSAPAITDEDHERFQKQCDIEHMKYALEAALKGEK